MSQMPRLLTQCCDCGAFVCCGALHAMPLYDKQPIFTQSDIMIPAFRRHIARRILRGDDWDKAE